ncbi:MAG: SUMF1/EgtB/PvdO family nonheme iron enzyme [Desulfovibrio sp.]|jgi:formylglycine-generating enzyme required for sulfatase activity|nr:SUMF1/EgtB/PvdO family nonheme iron enzyme [Desulfovibrio sp.]
MKSAGFGSNVAVALVVFSFMFLSAVEALALSPEDHAFFLKSSPAYADADKRLNEVWRELKGKLSQYEYSRLLTEQRLWLLKERDKQAAGFKTSRSGAEAYAAAITARVDELAQRYDLPQAQRPDDGQNTMPDAGMAPPAQGAALAPQPAQTPEKAETPEQRIQRLNAELRQAQAEADRGKEEARQGRKEERQQAAQPAGPVAQAAAPAPAPATSAPPAAGGKTHTNSIGMKFVLIPAGKFSRKLEKPVKNDFGEILYDSQTVIISQPFYLGQYEVTQEQWVAVMGGGNNPSEFKGRTNPVENVSWNDAQEFIKRLNAKEGTNRYRLPTEAEWEYAAKAGSGGDYFFGDYPTEEIAGTEAKIRGSPEFQGIEKELARLNSLYRQNPYQRELLEREAAPLAKRREQLLAPVEAVKKSFDSKLDAYAWFVGANAGGTTHPVGQKKPNPWGLYDIHGNVWELVQDWYADYPKDREMRDPRGPASGICRVGRGGSWGSDAKDCRSGRRLNYIMPGNRSEYVGFRLALSAQ